MWVQSLSQEYPPEEGMATHSSILFFFFLHGIIRFILFYFFFYFKLYITVLVLPNIARKVPWTEEPGGLQSTGQKVLDMTEVTEH